MQCALLDKAQAIYFCGFENQAIKTSDYLCTLYKITPNYEYVYIFIFVFLCLFLGQIKTKCWGLLLKRQC